MSDDQARQPEDLFNRCEKFLDENGWDAHFDAAMDVKRLVEMETARLTSALEAAERGLEDLPKQIPTNWTDSLLTGSDAALKGTEFDCRQVEALLRGIQDRQRDFARKCLAEIAEIKGSKG